MLETNFSILKSILRIYYLFFNLKSLKVYCWFDQDYQLQSCHIFRMSSRENGGNTLLKKEQIENLRNHVYKSSGTTVLDPYMQVYMAFCFFSAILIAFAPKIVQLIINILGPEMLIICNINTNTTLLLKTFIIRV